MIISRVVLQDYKSIAACDVRLGPLTFLVGPNGAGKSNFLDALHFLADATRNSLAYAIRQRGGVREIGRRSGDAAQPFGMRVEMKSEEDLQPSHYAILIAPRGAGGYQILKEEGAMRDALSQMAFYSLEPEQMRGLQKPEAGERLLRTGQNLPSVLRGLSDPARRRIEEYLQRGVPDLAGIEVKQFARQFETVEFRQQDQTFLAANMSDGTLRMLGVLTALFQSRDHALSLIGIEEPETALHPGAAAVLRDALREASEQTQVIVTTHSADVLDDKDIEADSLLAVTMDRGTTNIGPIDDVGRSSIRDHLYTAGELLRLNQLQPSGPGAPGRLFDQEAI